MVNVENIRGGCGNMPESNVYNRDCVGAMKETPDKFYELAVVDPPYGIGESKNVRGGTRYGKAAAVSKDYGVKEWDNYSPHEEYFIELKRVTKNQIIWGANHFISKIPFDSSCWIVWDKKTGTNGYADCELAYTSFETAVRQIRYQWAGMLQENMANKEIRIHPTQKPIALYQWLLKNYAQPGDHILDTHMGSQSSRIACYKMGFDYTGYEIDAQYFKDGNARFEKAIAEPLFDIPKPTQGELL